MSDAVAAIDPSADQPASIDVPDDASVGIEPPLQTAEPDAADAKPATDAAADSGAVAKAQPAAAGPKASGIKPPASRIGRPCCGNAAPKSGPPPLPEPQQLETSVSSGTMRRQPDEYSRSSHLSDVFEESEEAELANEYATDRSTKSRSPSEAGSNGRPLKGDRKVSSGSLSSEHYLEATGRRRNSDQSVVLTADTDSFIIGQRIWVGGIRPGHIAYIGETHFAPGDWAGVVLDEPSGKNDGCVSGKRYFQCEPKRGIFSRLTRLTRDPLPNAGGGVSSTPNASSTFSLAGGLSPSVMSRSGAVSPSASVRSYATGIGRTPSAGKNNLCVGDRIIVSSGLGSRPGILRYIGETHFASGTWCGIQLDESSGKNDGSVDNQRYFECPPNYGIFVPVAKVSLSPSSRKARLSRAGSRESLTSVGTIGSMASTVTSRMRMSSVQQRMSTPAKALTPTKNTVALQDILREKQNHIEQLLLEREMEKQESDSVIINYQKDINQLKETNAALEARLQNESKRSEDLQASIEEATFCGDELNAQTQDYRERIAKLEAQLADQQPNAEAASAIAQQLQADVQRLSEQLSTQAAQLLASETQNNDLTAQLAALNERLQSGESEWTIKSNALQVSENCLREEINFFRAHNEQLTAELRSKDEATEQEYLSVRHIEVELKEELQLAHDQRQQAEASHEAERAALQLQLDERDAQIAALHATAAQAATDTRQSYEQRLRDENASAAQLAAQQAAECARLSAQLHEFEGKADANAQESRQRVQLIDRLELDAKRSRDQLDEHTKTIGRQQKTVDELTERLAELQRTVDKKDADIRQLRQVRNESDEQRDRTAESVSNERTELQQRIRTLESELLEANGRHALALQTVDELRTSLAAVEQQRADGDGRLATLAASADEQSEQLQSVRAERDAANARLTDAQARIAALQLAEQQNAAEAERVRAFAGDLQQRLEQSECAAKGGRDALAALQLEHADVRRQLASAEQAIERAADERRSLQHGLEALRSSSSDAGGELQRVQAELERTQRTAAEAERAASGERLALERRLDEGAAELRARTADGERLADELRSLAAEKSTRENALNTEVARWRDALDTERRSLRADADRLRTELDDERRRALAERQAQCAEIERLGERLTETGERLTGELQAMRRQTDAERAERTANENVLNETCTQLRNAEHELRVRLAELSEAKCLLEIRHEDELGGVREQRDAAERRCDELRLEFRSTEDEQVDLVGRTVEMAAEIEELTGRLNEAENGRNDAQANAQQALADRAQAESEWRAEIGAVAERLRAAERATEAAEATAAAAGEQFAGKRVAFAEQIADLAERLSASEAANVALRTDLQSAAERAEFERQSAEASAAREADNAQLHGAALVELNGQLSRMQAESERLRASLDEQSNVAAGLRTERDALEAEIRLLAGERSPADADVALLVREARASLGEQADRLRRLDADGEAMRRAHADECTQLQDKYERFERAARDAQTERDAQAAEARRLQALVEGERAAFEERLRVEFVPRADCEALREQLDTLDEVRHGEVAELQRRLDEADAQANRLRLAGQQKASDELVQAQRTAEQLRTENGRLTERLRLQKPGEAPNVNGTIGDSDAGAQIAFLNTIIADMQQKNEHLLLRISALEETPQDYSKHSLYDVPVRREPAPRMFCDICDVFDAHETEDCPLQSSESPPPNASIVAVGDGDAKKERKLPPPRKYCDNCEEFGHEASECNAEETY